MTSNPFDSLPGDLGRKAARLVESREASGLNVHFINERGQRDRYSFADSARRDCFVRNLVGAGFIVFPDERAADEWSRRNG